jgi:hypothetical protein
LESTSTSGRKKESIRPVEQSQLAGQKKYAVFGTKRSRPEVEIGRIKNAHKNSYPQLAAVLNYNLRNGLAESPCGQAAATIADETGTLPL